MGAVMQYIFWSCPSAEEAKRLIIGLLENKMIACASIVPVTSLYKWEGEVKETKEVKVILKTREGNFSSIAEYIALEGSYKVPEIASVKVSEASEAYVSWLLEETVSCL